MGGNPGIKPCLLPCGLVVGPRFVGAVDFRVYWRGHGKGGESRDGSIGEVGVSVGAVSRDGAWPSGGWIDLDDVDHRRFEETLAAVVERFNWVLFAYCLMGNHYHLLVETPQGLTPSTHPGIRKSKV